MVWYTYNMLHVVKFIEEAVYDVAVLWIYGDHFEFAPVHLKYRRFCNYTQSTWRYILYTKTVYMRQTNIGSEFNLSIIMYNWSANLGRPEEIFTPLVSAIVHVTYWFYIVECGMVLDIGYCWQVWYWRKCELLVLDCY